MRFLGALAAAMESTYDIIRIEEDQTPLAVALAVDGAGLIGILTGAVVLVIVVIVVSYFSRCRTYHFRIRQLTDDKTVYFGWNEGRLRDTVIKLEIDRIRSIP